jgi:hypothetical protein
MTESPHPVKKRCFPRITGEFYESQPKLAQLSRTTTWIEALHLRRSHPFNRLLSAHRSAFEAEKQGRWRCSEFYWEEVASLFQTLLESHPCWSEAASLILPEDSGISGPDLRRCFRAEVLLDTHAGFFTGQIREGLAPTDRPAFHLAAISRYIRDSPDLDIEFEARYVDPLASLADEACRSKFVADVVKLWLDLAEHFPRQAQYQSTALAEIHSVTAQDLQDAELTARSTILAGAIASAERIRAISPSNLDAYILLANLYHEQAICFANRASLKDAFLALAKAEVYGGPSPSFVETRKQLTEIHSTLRLKVEQLRSSLREKPGAYLNDNGHQFVHSVETALSAASEWERAPSTTTIREQHQTAGRPPGRRLAPADPDILPFIRPDSIAPVAGAERFRDWLASASGTRMRWQLACAALLMLIAVSLLGREQWATHARQYALVRANLAIAAHHEDEALDAFADYFSAPRPFRWRKEFDRTVVDTYSKTLARWVAEKSESAPSKLMSRTDERRLGRYKSQILDKGLNPEVSQ